MASATVHNAAANPLIQAALRGMLSKAQARKLAKEDPELLVFALLAVSKRIAEQGAAIARLQGKRHAASVSTPSGMVPVYTKPNAPKRRKKPGAKPGHTGVRRAPPVKIDRRQSHRLKCCPRIAAKNCNAVSAAARESSKTFPN